MRTFAFVIGVCAALVLGAVPAPADWDHPVKWDQLPYDKDYMGSNSFINPLTQWDFITADDFPCTEHGWITDIEFTGCGYNIQAFRVKFWSDVPATANEESHPGDIPLYDETFDAADPADPLGLGWQQTDDFTYKINIPRGLWFEQVGGAAAPVVYWISIQGIIDSDNTGHRFYWHYGDRTMASWGDDAAYASESHGYDPWWHWGWITMTPGSSANLYQGIIPSEWAKSADMSFRLTGTPIPEPATLALVALGITAFLRQKRQIV